MSLHAVAAILLYAQAASSAATPPQSVPDSSASDDIIVEALRIPRDKLPVGVRWDTRTLAASRELYEGVQRYVACAIKIAPERFLREAVDGTPNSASTRYAQGAIVIRNGGCFGPMFIGDMSAGAMPRNEADFGASPMHRGAIIEAVMRVHAPGASLSRDDTRNPEVQRRFRSREGVRNGLRPPQELDALKVAVCMVEEQPAFATRMFRAAPGSSLERGLIQAMITGSRDCLRGVKSLTVDPMTFRTFIVDAFYRWVVAARDVDTLLPAARTTDLNTDVTRPAGG